MTVVRELVVTLGFDVDEKKLKSLEQSLENLKKLMLGVAGAATVAAGTLYALTKYASDSAAQIKNTAESMGISYDMFQKYSYAASLSGVKTEEFSASLRALNRAIADARYGNADMIMTFARTNTKYVDAAGNARNLQDVMGDLADSFAKMKDGPEKTSFAMKLFGEAGARLLPTFARGSAGLREMGDEIESIGGVLTNAEVELGNTMRQEFLRMQAMGMAIVRSVGMAIIPTMLKAAQSTKAWVTANRELIKQNLKGLMEGFGKVLYWIWRGILGVKDVIVLTAKAIDYLNEKVGFLKYILASVLPLFALFYLGKIAQSVYSAANAFIALGRAAFIANLKIAAIPILIGALVAAAFLILEDFVAFIEGRPSVLGFLIKNWDTVMARFKSAVDAAEGYIRSFLERSTSAVLQFLGVSKEQADAAGKGIGDAFTAATTRVKGAIDIWVGALAELYPIIKRIAGGLAGIFADIFGGKKSGADILVGLFDKVVEAAKLAAEEIKRAFSYGVFDYLESRFSNLIKMMTTIFGTMFPQFKFALENAGFVKNKASDIAIGAKDTIVNSMLEFNAPFAPGAMAPIFSPKDVAAKTADKPSYIQPIVTQTANVTATINVPPGTTAKEAEGYVRDGFGKAWESVRYHTGAALTPAVEY